MSLRDDLLPLVDDLRGLAAELGFRTFSKVEVYVKSWDGGRPGVGYPSITRTLVTVASGTQPAKVRSLTNKEIVASGGDLADEMYEIGPVTPKYGAGGMLIADILPDAPKGSEIFWHLVGPDGRDIWCKQVEAHTDRALGYKVRVKRTGEKPE